MFAVIKTGGKQYSVSPGEKIKIEKIDGKENEEVIFDQVLLLEKNKQLSVGTPFLSNAKVVGKILKQGKAEKVIVFRYKQKTRHKVKKGHRQPFTEIEIKKIEGGE